MVGKRAERRRRTRTAREAVAAAAPVRPFTVAARLRVERNLFVKGDDPRLDVLTAMYNPRKRVPATVEFADIPGRPSGSGTDALVDVAAYRNADAPSLRDVPLL